MAGLAKSEILNVIANRGDSNVVVPWWVHAAAPALAIDVVDWLLIAGPDPDEKHVGFLFADGDDHPSVVAKTARSTAATARVVRGYRALEELRSAGVGGRLAPEPLALLPGPSGELASLETAIRGTPLDGCLRRANEPHYAEKITGWLIDLGKATRRAEQRDAWPSHFRDVVEQFRVNTAGLVDRAFLGAACSRIEALGSKPTVCEHHDCSPWNLYVRPDRSLVAFDWDNANAHGIPAFDLVQALGLLAFSIDGSLGSRRFADSFRRAESGKRGAIRRECRSRYASALGMDADTMTAVRVFAWMRLTNDEFEARRRRGDYPAPKDLESSMLGLWREEARSAMDS